MEIILLEDDSLHQSRLETALYEIARNHRKKVTIRSLSNSLQIMPYIQTNAPHQLYFLDIQLEGESKSGLDIAKEIRDKNPFAVIVFVTSLVEMESVILNSHLEVFDEISKDLEEAEFRKRLEQVLLYVWRRSDRAIGPILHYAYKDYAPLHIPFADIFYIETSSFPHMISVQGADFHIECYGCLKDILKLDGYDYFYQVDRSMIVNMHNALYYNRSNRELVLHNGITCSVARARVQGVKKRLVAIQAMSQ